MPISRFACTPILLLFIIGLAGCGTVYLPAGWDANLPQTTPLRMTERHTYAGGDINVSGGYNGGESNIQGRAFYAAGNGGSWWRLSGSGFVYTGSYDVRHGDSSQIGTQFYIGPGGFADINVSLLMGDLSVGIGGFAGIIAEFGSYSKTWRSGGASTLMPLVGGYYFMSARFENQDQLGFQAQFGFPGFLSGNLQYDVGDFLISGGAGVTFSLGSRAGEIGRFTLGAAYRVR